MILNQTEENLHLDYKGAGSLATIDGKKKEISKDISAFANSDGGFVIYGIREFDDDATMTDEYKKMNDPEEIAMISLKMSQYAERSRNLAFSVQNEFVKVGRVSREAKQRPVGIWVLQAVAMPAILVELGFISNPEEEDYLNSEKGQKELSDCISRAVKYYKTTIESKINSNGGTKQLTDVMQVY